MTAIVFDKTGTLTEGKPVVTDIHCFDVVSVEKLVEIIGRAESSSEHPLGRVGGNFVVRPQYLMFHNHRQYIATVWRLAQIVLLDVPTSRSTLMVGLLKPSGYVYNNLQLSRVTVLSG